MLGQMERNTNVQKRIVRSIINFFLVALFIAANTLKFYQKEQRQTMFSNRGLNLAFVALVVVTFFLRLYKLDFPDTYYFDEVYHAFTAQAYAQNDPRGYEWWNTAPEGFAYEWLHPPVAKLFQAASIKLFGDTPLFWRFPGILFGTGVGVLLYLIGERVFKSKPMGLIAFFLWSFDGLSFTSSRITMNDICLAFWITLVFYLYFIKKPAWLLGLVLGLAVSTKWPGVFAIGMISLLWLRRETTEGLRIRSLLAGFASFSFLPAIVYLLSYSQFFLQGHTIDQFKELHQQIWWYQTNLDATHPYQSTPLEWAFLLRPLYAFTRDYADKISNIYLMGNPLVHWGGLVAVFFAILILAKERIKRRLSGERLALAVVLLGYFGMFVPWVFSPRIMFVYHYVPSLPFLFLVSAWVLNNLIKDKKRTIMFGYLLLVLIVFIYFYPHWSGMPVPDSFDKQYYWLPGWR